MVPAILAPCPEQNVAQLRWAFRNSSCPRPAANPLRHLRFFTRQRHGRRTSKTPVFSKTPIFTLLLPYSYPTFTLLYHPTVITGFGLRVDSSAPFVPVWQKLGPSEPSNAVAKPRLFQKARFSPRIYPGFTPDSPCITDRRGTIWRFDVPKIPFPNHEEYKPASSNPTHPSLCHEANHGVSPRCWRRSAAVLPKPQQLPMAKWVWKGGLDSAIGLLRLGFDTPALPSLQTTRRCALSRLGDVTFKGLCKPMDGF